jgi:hypothetical protein
LAVSHILLTHTHTHTHTIPPVRPTQPSSLQKAS